MMDGITVLSQNEIMTYPAWGAIMFMISVLLLIVFIMIYVLNNSNKYYKIIGIIACTGAILSTICLCIGGVIANFKNIPTGKYTYKVTISNEVNFVEFNNKYEVINQDGLIYTIKEREVENESN